MKIISFKKSVLLVASILLLQQGIASAVFKYSDPTEDDIFSLSAEYGLEEIENYTEDPAAAADAQVAKFKEQYSDYDLENDLIPQAVNMLAAPLLKAAIKINQLTEDDDTILYLGRSPVLLYKTAQLLKMTNKGSHVHVSYSGTPNLETPENRKCGSDLRNVITPERLEHFYAYLDAKGLNTLTADSALKIVDQVGKGAGMNAFLRILRHYYLNHVGLDQLPNVTLLLMNFQDTYMHIEKNCYMFNPKTSTFIFSGSTKNPRYKAIQVKALALCMDESENGPLDALDMDVIQYYFMKAREYPAFRWTAEYDAFRDSYEPLAEKFEEALKLRFSLLLKK